MGQMQRAPDNDAARRLNERVGGAIAKARKARDISQTQLGEAIGEAQATVSDYELGKTTVPIPVVVKIQHALDLGDGALFVASDLVPEAKDILDLIRRDPTITDDRRDLIIEIYESGRMRARRQRKG